LVQLAANAAADAEGLAAGQAENLATIETRMADLAGENIIAVEQGQTAVLAGLAVAGYRQEAEANQDNDELLAQLSQMGVEEYNIARVAAGNAKKAQRNANGDKKAVNAAANAIKPAQQQCPTYLTAAQDALLELETNHIEETLAIA